jgi:chromosome partitioning protein
MKILAIANRKGGCGKTTTAVNLAAECGARGMRTLLVDLDSQGHAGLGFGVVARRGQPNAHMIFTRPQFQLAEAIQLTSIVNVAVAPADLSFDGVASERSVARLRRQLTAAAIEERFDIAIVDTPPSLDFVFVNALAAADAALVPMIPHTLSAEGVRQFTRVFFRIATTINRELKLLGVLPVMVNARAIHHRSILRDMETAFGAGRMCDGIRNDIALSEAFAARMPVRAFAPRSRGAEDYRHLADQIDEIWPLRAVSRYLEARIA